MKIALIYLGRRGAGAPISYELAEHISQKAQLLAVLSRYVENLTLWQSSGLELITTTTYRTLPGAVWSWMTQFKLRKLAGRIRRWKPDVLLFPMFYTWNPFLQRHLREIPSVIAVHDPISHAGAADAAYELLENLSIRRAERCIVFSKALAPELSRRGADPQKIDHVPLGELSYYQRFLSETTARQNNEIPKLLFFGRITAYKGLEVLLRAVKVLSETQPVQLMVIGEGNLAPYKSMLDELPQVQLVNRWVDEGEIAGFFNQADIVALPYTAGSQSGVLPIAASFALPVIATRVGGIPEQIEHETTGLLVEPGSVTELTAAIQRLIMDPQFARELGANLQRDYRQNKNWKEISEKVFEVCERAAHQDQVNS